jgi:hypothetical protein
MAHRWNGTSVEWHIGGMAHWWNGIMEWHLVEWRIGTILEQ